MTGKRWQHALGEYVIALRAAGRSPGTIRVHRHYLSNLAEQVASPWPVTTAQLLRFMAVEHWSPETRRSARSVVRSFYRWAHGAGHVDENPALGLPAVKVPPSLPKPTPERVLRAALRAPEPREEFMVRLGACAGLRACEMAALHADWWDRETGILRVTGKGGKVRRVAPRDPALVAMLNGLHGYAFPNRWTGEPITAGHVTKLLSRALAETWTAHTLRHRFATTGLRQTRNLLAVSRALGHASVATTQIYTLLLDEELVELGEATAVA